MVDNISPITINNHYKGKTKSGCCSLLVLFPDHWFDVWKIFLVVSCLKTICTLQNNNIYIYLQNKTNLFLDWKEKETPRKWKNFPFSVFVVDWSLPPNPSLCWRMEALVNAWGNSCLPGSTHCLLIILRLFWTCFVLKGPRHPHLMFRHVCI